MSEPNETEIHKVGEVLLDACSSEKGLLRPWKPFDVWQVAKRCIEALRSVEAQNERAWQPIETAPRDGTRILLICNSAYSPTANSGWWNEGWWSYSYEPQEKFSKPLHQWFPTHWQPLPAPPRSRRGDNSPRRA